MWSLLCSAASTYYIDAHIDTYLSLSVSLSLSPPLFLHHFSEYWVIKQMTPVLNLTNQRDQTICARQQEVWAEVKSP